MKHILIPDIIVGILVIFAAIFCFLAISAAIIDFKLANKAYIGYTAACQQLHGTPHKLRSGFICVKDHNSYIIVDGFDNYQWNWQDQEVK
jgi:hypothetical protein